MRGPPPRGDLPEVPPDLADWLAAIIASAHRLRAIGSTERAVTRLRSVAERVTIPHVAAGLHALADLFDAHRPARKRVART